MGLQEQPIADRDLVDQEQPIAGRDPFDHERPIADRDPLYCEARRLSMAAMASLSSARLPKQS